MRRVLRSYNSLASGAAMHPSILSTQSATRMLRFAGLFFGLGFISCLLSLFMLGFFSNAATSTQSGPSGNVYAGKILIVHMFLDPQYYAVKDELVNTDIAFDTCRTLSDMDAKFAHEALWGIMDANYANCLDTGYY